MAEPRDFIPLSEDRIRRMDRIREFDPHAGWGVEQDCAEGQVFVDACGIRYYGDKPDAIDQAMGRALRALESAPRRYGVSA